jgi:SAM-dependent methyltransferase
MSANTPGDDSPHQRAAAHVDLGLPVATGVRLRSVKRVVARLARFLTKRQVAFNHAMLDADAADRQRLTALVERVEERSARLEELQVGAEAMREDQRRELGRWRTDHALVERVLREVRAGRSPQEALAGVGESWDSTDTMYVDFEDQHRGGAELIRRRLAEYVPDLARVAALGRVLDVGTGRGEFLEVMANAGIDAYGVDTNAASVARATERGLEAMHGDALAHLAELPEESLAAVTAFQVVEHLGFERLETLVVEALRVLRPGGLLILETPNPNNVIVGASTFYIDPTHERPLPPQLLHFVLWSRGFDPIEVRYVNPPAEQLELPEAMGEQGRLLQPVVDRLNEVLFAPFDYCVIGHRVAP